MLWLSNDPAEESRFSFEPDSVLESSIQTLAKLGFANMRVKMLLVGRCDLIRGRAQCQVYQQMQMNTGAVAPWTAPLRPLTVASINCFAHGRFFVGRDLGFGLRSVLELATGAVP